MTLRDIINDLLPKPKEPKSLPGLPRNVSNSGGVFRHPGVIIAAHTEQKIMQRAFEHKGKKYPALYASVHRAVDHLVFKARVNALKRKKAKRYVWA